MRQAEIYRKDILAGILTEDGGEYRFCYDEAYLKLTSSHCIIINSDNQTHTLYVRPLLQVKTACKTL